MTEMSAAPDLGAMARTLSYDGGAWLPIADRTFASIVADQLQQGLPVSNGDAHRLRDIYARRQDQVAAVAAAYNWLA
jgi:hypothetical protein